MTIKIYAAVTSMDARAATYYLKHTITNNIVTESYVCFVYDSVERCLKGFDTTAFSDNTTKIQAYQTAANLSTVDNPSGTNPGCKFDSSNSNCYGGGFYRVNADSYDYVNVSGSSSENCYVHIYGGSKCIG